MDVGNNKMTMIVDFFFVLREERQAEQLSQKVVKADYHGSILRVWRSKCPSYVGSEGIVVQETQNTVRLVTKEDKIKSE